MDGLNALQQRSCWALCQIHRHADCGWGRFLGSKWRLPDNAAVIEQGYSLLCSTTVLDLESQQW